MESKERFLPSMFLYSRSVTARESCQARSLTISMLGIDRGQSHMDMLWVLQSSLESIDYKAAVRSAFEAYQLDVCGFSVRPAKASSSRNQCTSINDSCGHSDAPLQTCAIG